MDDVRRKNVKVGFVFCLFFSLLLAFSLLHGLADPRERFLQIGALMGMFGLLVDCAFMLHYRRGMKLTGPSGR